MAISLQADSTLPQGYILVDGQRAATISTTGLSATLADGIVTNLQIASDAAIDGSKIDPLFLTSVTAQIDGPGGLIASRADASINGAVLQLKRFRGTHASKTAVLAGDQIGRIRFFGYDGANEVELAQISATVDDTPGPNDMPGRLVFSTTADGGSSPTERMRIDSFGAIAFNSTAVSTNTTVGGATWTNGAYHVLYRDTTSSSSGILDYYSNWGATKRNVFRVRADGNVLNYNNSYGSLSDASLKENVTDATPKLEDINKVRVVNFNFKGDDNKQIGVIAQEIEQVWPSIVSTEEDGTKSVKYSVLVPILIKAVQELSAKVAALESAQS